MPQGLIWFPLVAVAVTIVLILVLKKRDNKQ